MSAGKGVHRPGRGQHPDRDNTNSRERKRLARGHSKKQGHYRQFTNCFDTETFEQIRAYAAKEGMTISETIRTFVEWGLEQGGIK